MSVAAQDQVRLTRIEPQLFVTDIARACGYFRDQLGFTVVFTYGAPAYYAQVARDGLGLNLRHVDRSPIDADMRDRETLLSATLTVASRAEIDALHAEFTQRGAHFAEPPTDQPWGARTFIVRDLDGNLLLLAGPAA